MIQSRADASASVIFWRKSATTAPPTSTMNPTFKASEANSSVESSPVRPALWRPSSAITATASATAIQGSRRDTGRCSRLVDGGRLRLPAPVELGHEPRALGIGHLRPACDLGDAAPAAEAK